MSDRPEAAQLARNLFPGLAATLDRALTAGEAETRLGRRGVLSDGSATPGVPARDTFEAQLGAEVNRFQSRHAALAWNDVADEAARDAVLGAFALVRDVLRDSDIELPAPESFAGLVDLGAVADRFEAGLTPVPAPYGLGLDSWQGLFQRAAEQHPEQLDPREPFVIATEAVREFGLLGDVTAGPFIDASSGRPGVRWTLRLVPDGAAPALLGLNFDHGPHVTLPEMLMLQLMRVTAGLAPLDHASFTWLAGGLAAGKLGARHVYDVADRAVRISCREIGNQGPHLGARTPVDLAA
ncbi:hypothetical protein JOF28_000361 [Leucobacter exalbidus]|uniref:Uncharacterized protein n=1 Tax=Leucobacter exalbidus TaxID=662960 RepID=A0A940PPC2_9MICO|nr:hypothetical protein [Leucobacter exalbidus]MBP1325129.1 hypothetical protein [Leucobacter exalbidus]